MTKIIPFFENLKLRGPIYKAKLEVSKSQKSYNVHVWYESGAEEVVDEFENFIGAILFYKQLKYLIKVK